MAHLTGAPSNYPISSLENGIAGTCLCNSITVILTQEGLFTKPNGHSCHCANCRKFTGSATAHILRLPASNCQMEDPSGYYKTFTDTTTGSGDPISRGFCSNCGTSIGVIPEKSGGKGGGDFAFVWLGMFPRMPMPEFELFTAHRQEWVRPVEGAAQWDFLRSKAARDGAAAEVSK